MHVLHITISACDRAQNGLKALCVYTVCLLVAPLGMLCRSSLCYVMPCYLNISNNVAFSVTCVQMSKWAWPIDTPEADTSTVTSPPFTSCRHQKTYITVC